mmetsp:Transcript_22875/g.54299  ORF Transcript_22875/g.54299 Transcript_22875/m.54299 type:complete len:102 (-) Transcript_22875:1859-2164(-)
MATYMSPCEQQGSRNDFQNSTLDPTLQQKFEFQAEIPGEAQLKIEIWGRGWDALSDDLIGETTMDVEASAFVAGAICVQVRACDAMSCTVMHCHGDSACGG